MPDIRANNLEVGDRYREYGDDDIHEISARDDHGDRVLITTTEGYKFSFDIDEVVEVDPEPEDEEN
jgi:hypothetical protein